MYLPTCVPELGLIDVTTRGGIKINPLDSVSARPLGFVTITSTVPAGYEEVLAVTMAEDTTTISVAVLSPKVTVDPLWKLFPDIVTDVPPNCVPELGSIDVTTGGIPINSNLLDSVSERPLGFVTITSTVPAGYEEVLAVMMAEDTTTISVAVLSPKVTVDPLWKLFPDIVTDVPPNCVPELGSIDVTTGGIPINSNLLDSVSARPLGFVTITSTVPAG